MHTFLVFQDGKSFFVKYSIFGDSSEGDMSKNILAGDMWAVFNFGNPNQRYQKFLSTGKPRFQNFFDSTVLYDEIVIPTDDFMSLAVLVGVLGVGPVSEMLDAGVIRFVRAKGALAYIGNGGGLLAYKIRSPDGIESPFAAPLEESIMWALNGLNSVDKTQAKNISDKVIMSTKEISLTVDGSLIREQTYADILASSYLRDKFHLTGNLSSIPGIAGDQVRIYDGLDSEADQDQISTLLKLAFANLEMRLADLAECSDVSTGSPTGHLLRGKQERARAQQLEQGKAALKEIANIPDIGTWMLSDPKQIVQLLKLRSSSSGIAFRKWFHEAMENGDGNIAKAYIELLSEVPPLQKPSSRALRFLVTAGWGIVEPISGTIAAAADNFLIDRFLNRSSPKFFLENLKQLPA